MPHHKNRKPASSLGEHADLVTVLRALARELSRAIASGPLRPTTT